MSFSIVVDVVASPCDVNRLRRYLEVEERGALVVADALHINIAVPNIDVAFIANLIIAPLDVIDVGAGNCGLVFRPRIDLVGRVGIEEAIVEVFLLDVKRVGLLARVVASAFNGNGARIVAGVVVVAIGNRVVDTFRVALRNNRRLYLGRLEGFIFGIYRELGEIELA